MSLSQIFDLFDRPYPKKNPLNIIDEYFRTKSFNSTEINSCMCGCTYSSSFFDLIDLPECYFKIILTHCIEKTTSK